MARAALATDRGFLRAGPATPARVAIIESALEVADADADADPGTRARLLALLAEGLASGARRTELARTYVDPTNPKRVAISADVPDVDALVAFLQSEDGAAAAASDGVALETVVLMVEARP